MHWASNSLADWCSLALVSWDRSHWAFRGEDAEVDEPCHGVELAVDGVDPVWVFGVLVRFLGLEDDKTWDGLEVEKLSVVAQIDSEGRLTMAAASVGWPMAERLVNQRMLTVPLQLCQTSKVSNGIFRRLVHVSH
jgi:hypothetical protein